MTQRLTVNGDDIRVIPIASVEGLPMKGVRIKPLLRGENGLLIEVHVKKGTVTPTHTHDHESLCYILRGKLRVSIGHENEKLGPGDAFLHPEGVSHTTEVLEDTVWLEIKTPPHETW